MSIDGSTLKVAFKAKGWAAHGKRGARRTYSEGQMAFVEWCYERGNTHKGDKMNANTAERLMAVVGTAAFNAHFAPEEAVAPDWKYPSSATSKPLFRAKDQLDHWTIKPWFSQQKAAFQAKLKDHVEAAKLGIKGYLGMQTIEFLVRLCARASISDTHPGEKKARGQGGFKKGKPKKKSELVDELGAYHNTHGDFGGPGGDAGGGEEEEDGEDEE